MATRDEVAENLSNEASRVAGASTTGGAKKALMRIELENLDTLNSDDLNTVTKAFVDSVANNRNTRLQEHNRAGTDINQKDVRDAILSVSEGLQANRMNLSGKSLKLLGGICPYCPTL